jgi:hypothetical protein
MQGDLKSSAYLGDLYGGVVSSTWGKEVSPDDYAQVRARLI